MLAQVDGRAAALIRQLRARKQLSASERQLFATYVALFDARVPRFRRWLKELAVSRRKLDIGLRFQSNAKIRQLLITSGLVEEYNADHTVALVAGVLKSSTAQLEEDQVARLRFLFMRAAMLAPRFMKLRWVVAHIENETEFMTSDYPLLSSQEDDLLIFPIAADSALILIQAERDGPIVHADIDDERIYQANIQVARASERLVLSRSEGQLRRVVAEAGILGVSPPPIFPDGESA